GYVPSSPSMREALSDRDRWTAHLAGRLVDRAAAVEIFSSERARRAPSDVVLTGVGLGQLWARRAQRLSGAPALDLDPSTIPARSPEGAHPALLAAAHLLPYRVSLDVVRGGTAFSWIEPALRVTSWFSVESVADLLAIEGSGRVTSIFGLIPTLRARGVSLGAPAAPAPRSRRRRTRRTPPPLPLGRTSRRRCERRVGRRFPRPRPAALPGCCRSQCRRVVPRNRGPWRLRKARPGSRTSCSRRRRDRRGAGARRAEPSAPRGQRRIRQRRSRRTRQPESDRAGDLRPSPPPRRLRLPARGGARRRRRSSRRADGREAGCPLRPSERGRARRSRIAVRTPPRRRLSAGHGSTAPRRASRACRRPGAAPRLH